MLPSASPDGQGAAWPECDREHAMVSGVGEGGADLAGRGVPQVGAPVAIASRQDASRPERQLRSHPVDGPVVAVRCSTHA